MHRAFAAAAVLFLGAAIIGGCNRQPAQAVYDTSPESNTKYLADYKAKPGVMARPSGLMYRVIKAGTGASPMSGEDIVTVTYSGALIDGTVFDKTLPNDTAEFPAGGLIPGWQEALSLMKEGDEWEIVIPSELGYGTAGASNVIPPNQTLVFQMALLKVTPPAAMPVPPQLNADANAKFLADNKAKAGVMVRPSGLQYRVVKAGKGATPKATDLVTVTYKGSLIDGTVFDMTAPGDTAEFPAGRLIPGWVEALSLMKEGDEWELVIPADLAYGARGAPGAIPPNQALVFQMALLKVAAPPAAPANP